MNSKQEESSNYNYPQISAEVNHVIARCRWADSYHWSSCPYRYPKNYSKMVIQIAYLRKSEWIALIFGNYHSEAVEIVKEIPKRDRYFFKATYNAYLKSRAWCIEKQYFDNIYRSLEQKEGIEIEFVIPWEQPGYERVDYIPVINQDTGDAVRIPAEELKTNSDEQILEEVDNIYYRYKFFSNNLPTEKIQPIAQWLREKSNLLRLVTDRLAVHLLKLFEPPHANLAV